MAAITISRGTFSGGQSIAEHTAKALGYRCMSREILTETARRYDISEEKLYKAITEVPGAIDRRHSERRRYLACLRAVLISMAKTDNVVYHGHAGHLLLRSVPLTFKVRVIANIEFRIQVFMNRQHLSREEAVEYIKRVDEERARWTRVLYHMDWHDPALYDFMINLDHVTLSGACDILYQAANMEEFKVTPESRKLMDDLILSSHLEAIIANNGSIAGGENIEIESNEGVVTLRGTVESLADADRVRMIVRETPGVDDVVSQMRVRLPGVTLAGIRI